MDSDSSPTKKGSKSRGRGRGASTTPSNRGRPRGRGRGKRAVKVCLQSPVLFLKEKNHPVYLFKFLFIPSLVDTQ